MPLESAEFISELNPSWPLGSDNINQGDDHDRVTKKALQQSFPNIDAEVSSTPAQINSWEARIAALEPVYGSTQPLSGGSVIIDLPETTSRIRVVATAVQSNNGANLRWRFRESGVVSNTGYASASAIIRDGSSTSAAETGTNIIHFVGAAGQQLDGPIEFVWRPGHLWSSSHSLSRRETDHVITGGGTWQGTGLIDGIELSVNSGTLSGSIVLTTWNAAS